MNQDFYNEFALRYEVGFDSLNVYVDTKKSPLFKGLFLGLIFQVIEQAELKGSAEHLMDLSG